MKTLTLAIILLLTVSQLTYARGHDFYQIQVCTGQESKQLGSLNQLPLTQLQASKSSFGYPSPHLGNLIKYKVFWLKMKFIKPQVPIS